ncbi:MAG TPA: hypothetical protein VFB03_03625 [Candidatus Saccharimonadales bacterium]|nr:hypothetical protein [Candidatus Saccharimonadales bacterium]
MKTKKNNLGFGVFELFLFLAILLAVGLVAYRVYNSHNSASNSVSTSTTPANKTTSAADVKAASQSLDAQSIDKSLDPSQLDDAVQSLL